MAEPAFLFKNKRRSAHGFSSSPQTPVISSPTNFVKLSGMGNVGKGPGCSTPARPTVNSAMTSAFANDEMSNGGAAGEPLFLDYEQVHLDDRRASNLQEAAQTSPMKSSSTSRTATPRTSVILQPISSHPIFSSSEDDDAAPPPIDFTRRSIHIPMRTR
jgi:hypothetical protein